MTDRPSDAVTGKVVARQLNKKSAFYVWNTHGEEDDPYFTTDDTPPEHGTHYLCADPRDDTDAALELLHHIINLSPYGRLEYVLGGWHLSLADENDTRWFIPISGEPFRYAVVHLAAKAWGIS